MKCLVITPVVYFDSKVGFQPLKTYFKKLHYVANDLGVCVLQSKVLLEVFTLRIYSLCTENLALDF